MASLLIFARAQNIHEDSALQYLKFQRGDVIDIQDDDGFYWGKCLTNPDEADLFRVVVLPGVVRADLEGLLSQELPIDHGQPQGPYQIRVNSIDLDALEAQAPDVVSTPLSLHRGGATQAISSAAGSVQVALPIDAVTQEVVPEPPTPLILDATTFFSARSVKAPLLNVNIIGSGAIGGEPVAEPPIGLPSG